MSVLLEQGDAFVGDLAMNGLPMRWGPGMTIFSDSRATVIESWRKLLDLGATRIHPAHGRAFPASVFRKGLESG